LDPAPAGVGTAVADTSAPGTTHARTIAQVVALASQALASQALASQALASQALATRAGERREALAHEIVAALLDVGRHWPRLHADDPADAALAGRATEAARRLARGMPFQYAVERASFRHLTLHVDSRVLIPRPETELLVDLVLEATGHAPGGTVVDVGTGSGAIALALAEEGRFRRVIATDVSADALAVARGNAEALGPRLAAPVELRQGSLLGPVAGMRARAIVSNPPYISFDEAAALPALVRDWEPVTALLSADQGLAVTRELVRDAAAHLESGGTLALEVDARRAALVAEMVAGNAAFSSVSVRLDLAGRERFVLARRREWR
jgi:release factor glutamine methyltransferase